MISLILTVLIILGFLLKVYKTPTLRTKIMEEINSVEDPITPIVIMIVVLWILMALLLWIPRIMVPLFILIIGFLILANKIKKKHKEDEEEKFNKDKSSR